MSQSLTHQHQTSPEAAATVEEWQEIQQQRALQLERLSTRQVAIRAAELIRILEGASVKIDRFGWSNLGDMIKKDLEDEWCDVLSPFSVSEVKAGVAAVLEAAGGKIKSINEYQVKAAILAARKSFVDRLPKREEPKPQFRVQLTEEELASRRALSAELLGKAAGSTKMPRPQTEAQTQANINAAKDMAETDRSRETE